MRRLLAGGLAWSLICLATAPAADQTPAPPADSTPPLPEISISLGRPEPLPDSTAVQVLAPTAIELTAFHPSTDPLPRVVRAHSPDTTDFATPQPLSSAELLTPIPATTSSNFAAGNPVQEQRNTAFATPSSVKSDCDGCGCNCYDCCVRMHRFYVRGEYLLWWIKNPTFPVLVTTGTVDSQGI